MSILITYFISNSLYSANPCKIKSRLIISKTYCTLLSHKTRVFNFRLKLSSVSSLYFSNKKNFIRGTNKYFIKDVLRNKKEQILDSQQILKERSENIIKGFINHKNNTKQRVIKQKQHLIKEILDTKAKFKERLEEVVEKENVFTLPNMLCILRIVMSPYLGYVIVQDHYSYALGLLAFAGITDLLDGWIARNWAGQSSKMGSFLDPMADKVLIGTLFVTLTWQHLIPLPLTLLIVSRDVALVVAGFVIRYRSLPPPRTLSRYFDVTHATAQLAPTFVSKLNTAIQLSLVGTALASPVFGYVDHPALDFLFGITAVSTIVSAISYLVSKNTYMFLKNKKL